MTPASIAACSPTPAKKTFTIATLSVASALGALICAYSYRVICVWACETTVAHYLYLPLCVVAVVAALIRWPLRRWLGAKTLLALTILLALWGTFLFCVPDGLLEQWRRLTLHSAASPAMYFRALALSGAILCVPAAFLMGFAFPGLKCGARPVLIWIIALCCGFLVARGAWLLPPPDVVRPYFGLYAARDYAFTAERLTPTAQQSNWQNVTQKYTDETLGEVLVRNGRILSAERLYTSTDTAIAFLPFLLKPAGQRFVFRGPDVDPYLARAKQFVADIPNGSLAEGQLVGLYDAIFIATPPVWTHDAASYATPRFLKRFAQYLTPDGLLLLQLDARALTPRHLATRLNALRQTYPHVQLWLPGLNDVVIVASRRPITASFPDMLKLLERPATALLLAQAKLDSLPALLANCLTAAPSLVDESLPKAPTMFEAAKALPLLYDPFQGARLLFELEDARDMAMAWVTFPGYSAEDAALYSGVLRGVQVARAHAALANRLLAKGDRDAAIKEARAAATLNANDSFMYEWVDRLRVEAKAFGKLSENQRALTDYQLIFTIAEPDPQDLYQAGLLAKKLGRAELAVAYQEQAHQAVPDIPLYTLALAELLLERGNYQETEALYDQVITLAPAEETADVLILKAKLFAKKENPRYNPEEAVRLAKIVCEAHPQELRYGYALADIYIEIGKPLEGVRLKRQLLREHQTKKTPQSN